MRLIISADLNERDRPESAAAMTVQEKFTIKCVFYCCQFTDRVSYTLKSQSREREMRRWCNAYVTVCLGTVRALPMFFFVFFFMKGKKKRKPLIF